MKLARLLLIAVPFALATLGCQPECVDFADCAEKAKKENVEYTCVANVCKPGTPFPATDGGTP